MFSGIFFDDQPGFFETITPLAGASKEVGDLGHPMGDVPARTCG